MADYWAIKHSSGELLSLKLAVIIHDNPRELEWLLPSVKATPVRGRTPQEVAHHLGRRVLLLKDHPDMASVQWPLNRRDFW